MNREELLSQLSEIVAGRLRGSVAAVVCWTLARERRRRIAAKERRERKKRDG